MSESNDNKQDTTELNIDYPAQRILFGSPGTGKSYKVHNDYLNEFEKEDVFKTVFHPEYKYGDFMGRLMPLTKGSQVCYEYQSGHFLKALAKAYSNILKVEKNDKEPAKVAIVIDEINRGNSSAIFGTVFQLLDRDESGWSSYDLDLSDIEKDCLIKEMGFSPSFDQYQNLTGYKDSGNSPFKGIISDQKNSLLADNNKIRIPPNLSFFATMNTSDESIYYMDSAFKRRWDWEFVPVDSTLITTPEGNPFKDKDEDDEKRVTWQEFAGNLNSIIKSNGKHIRKVEDKLIGHHFLKAPYSYDKIQSKLMFFLWDTVFSNDKAPLNTLLGLEDDNDKLVTFGDFADQVKRFIEKVNNQSESK